MKVGLRATVSAPPALLIVIVSPLAVCHPPIPFACVQSTDSSSSASSASLDSLPPDIGKGHTTHAYGGLNSIRYHEPTLGGVEDVLAQLVTARVELADAQRT